MKRFFRFLMAAAVMFGAVACSQTDELQEVTGGEEVVTTLSLELEDLGTRLAGDSGKIDKVAWGIYDQAGNFLAPHSSANKGVADFNGKKAEIEVRLFTGKVYDLVFFAYCSANNAYTIDWKARKLNVSYADNANLEARDAFFHIENGFVAGPSATFTLKRPFAQLNAGQSMVDYNNMQLTQNCIIESKLTTEAYAAMDLKTGKVVDTSKVPVVLAMNDVIDLNGDGNNDHLLVGKEPNVTEYKHLSMNYLLVDDKELVDVKLNLLGNEGTNFEREYFNVPLQRNYRTNILGSLISEPSVFTILIDAEFDGDHAVAVDPETSALEGILAPLYNQETAHVALQQDVTWTTGASHGSTPLVPADSPLMELVIEGTNITRESVQPTIYFTGEGVGEVRAANGGKIIFRNVKIVDLSESYNEAAWELGYLEMAGNLEFENCTFVNAVMVCGGTANNNTAGNATFKKCYFNSYDENQYGAWVSGLNASFEECTFEGWRGLKTHEAYGAEVATLVVDNCDFTLTKKPGLAIGDVNAETAITIKNSTFSTQPGDQGLYIYETDTDVTTFNLVLENNTIVANTAEEGADLLLKAKEGDTVLLPTGEYTVPAGIANNVTIEGRSLETVINATKAQGLNGKSINFKNLTINKSASNPNYNGYQHTNEVSYYNCVINNQIFLYGAKETFTQCTFNQPSADAYNVWTYGANEVIFNECTFNSAGKSILVYKEVLNDIVRTVTLNNCTINASAPVDGKAAVEVDSSSPNKPSDTGSYVVNINNTTANGFANGNVSGNSLWNNKKGDKLTLYVDGIYCVAPAPVADENGNYTVKTGAGLAYALANVEDGATITLIAEGSYEGTFKPVDKNLVIKSADANNKATIKGRVNIDNYADGIKFENIKFDINDASKAKNTFSGAQYKYPAVVVIYATATNFEGCEFKSDIAQSVCGINYGAHAAGKMLKVNNCKFTGDFYAVRTRTQFSITNSIFDIYYAGGKMAAVWTWGNGNTWSDYVEFTGNTNVKSETVYSVQLASTNFKYNNILFNVQNNTNFEPLSEGLNPSCDYTGKSFAEGSETF